MREEFNIEAIIRLKDSGVKMSKLKFALLLDSIILILFLSIPLSFQ